MAFKPSFQQLDEDFTVDTSILVDEDAVVARVHVEFFGHVNTYTGSSKRHPEDEIDETVGIALALARAFHKATTDLMLSAEQRVTATVFANKLFLEPTSANN